MAKQYYEADKLRWERKNEEAWLIGAYYYRALDAILGNFLRGGKGEIARYPEAPIKPEKKPEEKTEAEQEQDAVFALAYMQQMMQRGKNWGKKG